MNDKTFIVTRSGGENGMGHAVRMGHLAKAFVSKGDEVEMFAMPSEPGYEYFKNNGLQTTDIETLFDKFNRVIIDVPITDNNWLGDIRPYVDQLIVVVGTGWSINPMTRKLADLIVYQGIGEPDKEVLQASGGAVLYGLEWLILGKEYEINPDLERQDFVLYYCGGGIPQDYAEAVRNEIKNLGLDVSWRNQSDPAGNRGSLYDLQSKCAVQVSTFGMTTYEALTLRTPTVSFSRSEDHAQTEYELESDGLYLASMGLYKKIQPSLIARYAKRVIEKNLLGFPPPEELDGRGTQRLADYILREL